MKTIHYNISASGKAPYCSIRMTGGTRVTKDFKKVTCKACRKFLRIKYGVTKL